MFACAICAQLYGGSWPIQTAARSRSLFRLSLLHPPTPPRHLQLLLFNYGDQNTAPIGIQSRVTSALFLPAKQAFRARSSLQVRACIRVSSPPTRDPLHNNNSHQFRPFSSTKDMTVKANLQSVEDIEFTASERAIFNVLKATLQYPANPETKAGKLAADIEFFCKSAEGAAAVDELLWYIWAVIVEIAQQIPPAHPWQVSLIESLDNLRQRHGSILGRDKVSNMCRNSPS